jgi:hypothetical protein
VKYKRGYLNTEEGSDGELSDVVLGVFVMVLEGERAVLGLVSVVVVVGVGGGEVDSGEALERGKEGGGHRGAHPARHLVQLLPRYDAVVVVLHINTPNDSLFWFSLGNKQISKRSDFLIKSNYCLY